MMYFEFYLLLGVLWIGYIIIKTNQLVVFGEAWYIILTTLTAIILWPLSAIYEAVVYFKKK